MGDGDARATVERYWRALGERDFDTVRQLFTDDVLVEWPQSREHFRGKEACLNVFSNYPGGPPRVTSMRGVSGEGDHWVAEAEMEYPGDKRYLVVGIFEFREGRIAHETDYFAEPFPAPEWRMQWVDRD